MKQLRAFKSYIEQCEETYFQHLHVACDGNQSEITRVAQISRATVRAKLKKYGLLPEHMRARDADRYHVAMQEEKK